jgi:membrane protein DedA with SNARE-associated domain
MTLETIVVQFGYPALIIGLLFEGETMLVLGAFMAHRGYLNLPLVILIGWIVSFASDQFFFWLGRTKGGQFLENRPAWKPHVEKAKSLLGWNTNLLFLGIRFMYGLRTVLPFVIGMSKLDPKKFAILDLIGALIWALTFGLAGQLFGHLMAAIFEDVKEHELVIVLCFILAGAGVSLYYHYADKVRKPRNL